MLLLLSPASAHDRGRPSPRRGGRREAPMIRRGRHIIVPSPRVGVNRCERAEERVQRAACRARRPVTARAVVAAAFPRALPRERRRLRVVGRLLDAAPAVNTTAVVRDHARREAARVVVGVARAARREAPVPVAPRGGRPWWGVMVKQQLLGPHHHRPGGRRRTSAADEGGGCRRRPRREVHLRLLEGPSSSSPIVVLVRRRRGPLLWWWTSCSPLSGGGGFPLVVVVVFVVVVGLVLFRGGGGEEGAFEFGGVEDGAPRGVLLERRRVADDPARAARPRYGDVEAVRIVEEPEPPVGAHGRDDDDVELAALERIDRRDLDARRDARRDEVDLRAVRRDDADREVGLVVLGCDEDGHLGERGDGVGFLGVRIRRRPGGPRRAGDVVERQRRPQRRDDGVDAEMCRTASLQEPPRGVAEVRLVVERRRRRRRR
mmetsp:Transcript_14426/g.57483  ORF Transcript_14426/g.57483 Transcript_14426/m.57483 type:complete len:432 (+) Transcript_14426:167-1462(+)